MKKIALTLLALIVVAILLSGCGGTKAQKLAGTNYSREQLRQQQALAEQLKTTPVEFPQFSDERANINERNIRLNDPNKITYIYAISFTGQIIMHDTAKGKVSACNAQILPEEGPIRYRGDDLVVPQPEPDGSFTPSHECIFWFTPQGAYREYEGPYMMSDQPFAISNPVQLVVNADADITKSTHASNSNDRVKK